MDIGTHDTGKSQGLKARSPVDGSGGRSGYWIQDDGVLRRWNVAAGQAEGNRDAASLPSASASICNGIVTAATPTF
ncbi:hypothetical protein CH63R_04611 [Colletotrichum higginsianum IMI 349063]|uniref:Uncharacterized protein n=1 Tax=Colletotrichum higginsianum (strain IMI 349063) TaxID=759273 RepID=A0A1B7YJZ3_COLHI|nr:hypothetical protein CH63R_04611 [Colletotrichum higginsianum IMI 349063]OBR12315.1 hypothetical protein CH63R_04611 [Colletotrichum higginsianum IMI 349063]GJC93998.1 hypothetical protein ColKHC_02824 [Colletotrichum higginsianum]